MEKQRVLQAAWYRGIAFRISMAIAFLMVLSILFMSMMILKEEQNHTERQLLKIGIFISETLAHQASLSVMYQDRRNLEHLISAFRSLSPVPGVQNFVAYILVYDQHGRLLAHSGDVLPLGTADLPSIPQKIRRHMIHKTSRGFIEISAPIVYRQRQIGMLRAGITEKYRQALLHTVERKTLFAAGLLMLSGILASLFWARRFLRPIIQLAHFARRVGDGQWGETVPVTSSDEIGCLARDFNEMSVKLKGAFDDIQKAQNRLIRAEKFSALGKLSANLAHELKNPLTSIKMIMEGGLNEDGSTDFTAQDVEILLYEVQRMEVAVNETLSFAGPQRLHLQPLDLNAVIRHTHGQIRYKLEIAGIQTHLLLSEDVPVFRFDDRRMEQILMNLLFNAIQAMKQGGELTLQTEWNDSTRQVRIRITDTGVGIPASEQNQIFDPFFTTKKNGTGLGLSIVYSLVRDHGGQIEVTSEPGEGTTFWITLPVEEIVHA